MSEVVASIRHESSGVLDHVETHVSREGVANNSKISEKTVPLTQSELEPEATRLVQCR